jgi:hypothetical protein
MSVDLSAETLAMHTAAPIGLGGDHLNNLSSAADEFARATAFSSGNGRSGGRMRSAKRAMMAARWRRSSRPCGCAGEVAHLAGIDHDDAEPGDSESRGDGIFEAAGGLEDNHGGRKRTQVLDQGGNAIISAGVCERLTLR